METQVWIIGQILIDIILVALLIWFIRANQKREASWQEHEAVISRSQAMLGEMSKISKNLEENLQEKKELGQQILQQLDQSLKKAQESYEQLNRILPKSGGTFGIPQGPGREAEKTRFSIRALLEKGLSKEEISQHLGISQGEIDLFLKLKPGKGGMKKKAY